jgi:hypothetical protein
MYRGYPIVAACRLHQVVWLFIVFDAAGSALAQASPITPSGLKIKVSAPTTSLNGQVNYDITAGFSAGTVTVGGAQARVIDPAQETTDLSFRQIVPSGFLTQTFAVYWSAGCQS